VATRFVGPLAGIADVAVLLVPALPDAVDAARFVGLLDGLLLTGACSNLSARRYGQERQEPCADEGRDEVALSLAATMIEAGRPVFGICRGLQELNVLFGGTLAADVGLSGHHSGDDDHELSALFNHHHDVEVMTGGVLAACMGAGSHRVNSVHHQGIDRLGAGLAVEARAPDALVEAVSARPCGAPVVGVQWHPEWDATDNPQSRAFFDLVGSVVRSEACLGLDRPR
jgi:putative glutamine amidotransferase